MQEKTITTIAGEISAGALGAYRSHKSVHATPMTRGEYNTRRRWQLPHYEDASEPGYLVIYNMGTCREYASWSPDDIFEEGYSKLQEQGFVDREQGLHIFVGGGQLNISIGVDVLAHAISMGPAGIGGVKVTDADAFARSLVGALLGEEEDGSTPVHRMLDEVAEQLAEEAADGIRFTDDGEDEDLV